MFYKCVDGNCGGTHSCPSRTERREVHCSNDRCPSLMKLRTSSNLDLSTDRDSIVQPLICSNYSPEASRMNHSLSVVAWNTEWAKPSSPRGTFFAHRLDELASPVICLTEACAELLPGNGNIITSAPDYGYSLVPGRRKVLLWSQATWRDVDTVGDASLPSGRFVAGTTDTPLGEVRFIGVCIPWRDAHVRTGRRDRAPWQDHLTYLKHLAPLLSHRVKASPTVLLGDFNQRVPRARQPRYVFSALADALDCGFVLTTAGPIPGTTELSIDHLAATCSLSAAKVEHLDRHDEHGVAMSDHFGIRVTLQGNQTARGGSVTHSSTQTTSSPTNPTASCRVQSATRPRSDTAHRTGAWGVR